MNEKEFIQKLASRGRMEEPPHVDVADSVIHILKSRSEQKALQYRPVVYMASVCAMVAIITLVVTFWAFEPLVYSLMAFFMDPPLGVL